MPIPRTLHQLWKTADVPARFTALRETWRRRNPRWEVRLWTDDDLEALVEARYPALLPLYRGYAHPICRADLGRYLVLETFGGVYADLDCECLRPLDSLLEGHDLVVGLEPDAHLHDAVVVESGLPRLVCPTFIASAAGHPFWALVRGRIAEASAGPSEPLNLTGTFLFTRAVADYADPPPIDVLPAPLLYPFAKLQCWDGSVYDLEVWERCSREAYAAHYWDGGWFRSPAPLDGLPWTLRGRVSGEHAAPATYPTDARDVRISCVTFAERWSPALDLAIHSYLRQTHANRELLIAGLPAGDPSLGDRLATYRDRGVRLAGGVADAAGELLCRWDAGELQDPRRLEIQLRTLMQTRANACLLARRLHWRPDARRMAISADAPDLASLLCQKPFWPADAVGEIAAMAAMASARVTTIDLPRLSLRLADADAFEAAWRNASARFEADRCDAVAEELAKRLPLALAAPPAAPARKRSRPGEIVILTPIKDGRARLPRYFELVSRLDSGGAPLSIAFMEGDSRDGGFEALQGALPSLQGRFDRIEAYRCDDGFAFDGPRWTPAIQRQRRAVIARARNRLLDAALGDAAWALWLDVDLIDYPPDLLMNLLAVGKDIVAPHCTWPNGASFDLNTFIFAPGSGGKDDPADLRDGIFQPPRGKGRLYLEDVAAQDLVQVDAVGGAALLVRADLHRQGLRFPTESYGGYIETEGLAMMARERGVSCWALPKLRIVHPADEEPA